MFGFTPQLNMINNLNNTYKYWYRQFKLYHYYCDRFTNAFVIHTNDMPYC